MKAIKPLMILSVIGVSMVVVAEVIYSLLKRN